MRIVAGSVRGRRLASPTGSEVRPTSDRVREAMFNALTSLDAIEGARVLDLFAGSGALGLEALSRGAAHVDFVEKDRATRSILTDNIDRCGFIEQATVVAAEATSFLAAADGHWRLILLDPPYACADWDDLLASVARVSTPDALVVIESNRDVPVPGGWRVEREKRYGGTLVAFTRPPSSATEPR